MATEKKRVAHFTGNLGNDPKIVDTKAGEVVKFSLAVPVTDGSKEDPGDTLWVDLSIFDEKMQARAVGPVTNQETMARDRSLGELHKGDKIAVVGVLESRDYEGKTFYQMIPRRISHVDWWEKVPYQPRESVEYVEPEAFSEFAGV